MKRREQKKREQRKREEKRREKRREEDDGGLGRERGKGKRIEPYYL